MDDNSILIIGAGFAGLSAGIYAQMNGYHTRMLEMGSLPGGLCTAWKRKGYTIDGCIHWLVGSSPKSGMNRYWQEVGVAQGRQFVNLDEYMRYVGADGRTVIMYTDIDKLEKHLLELSPQDVEPIRQFINGIRLFRDFDVPSESEPWYQQWFKKIKLGLLFTLNGKEIQNWMKITAAEFSSRFKDPLIRAALDEMWLPEFSMLFMLVTFAYLHNQNAGYPLGGSLPMSLAMAKRYLALGGVIQYDSKVEKVLVEGDKAIGVQLADGSELRAGRVISAADGYTTIFKMLDGKYADQKVREPYEKWPIFQPLIYIGVGVKRSFEDIPKTVSGISFQLSQPVEIGDALRDRLPVHIFNQDPNLAPPGKTSLVIMYQSNHAYWKVLAQDETEYKEKKDQIARTVVELLDRQFPGLAQQVEMVDVSTPLTFERYTGNWQGSFEGWLITPENSYTMLKPMSQTLPGLQNFYMCGHWVEPGGGLPTGVMSARRLFQAICKEDSRKFTTTID
jgi:phytoene dehydrogenase-like protein